MSHDSSETITLTWFGHSCFRIGFRGSVLYFDPIIQNRLLGTILEPDKEKKPHVILISHEHWDHCHPKTVLDLCTESTVIYGPPTIEHPLIHEMSFRMKNMKELKEASKMISVVKSGEYLQFDNFEIKCLAAQEGLAYLLQLCNRKLLFMGDSPAKTEMMEEDPDIIIFPIWAVKGEEAELDDFRNLAKDALCIPMHYHESPEALPNFLVDMNEIKDLLKDVNLRILKRGEPIRT